MSRLDTYLPTAMASARAMLPRRFMRFVMNPSIDKAIAAVAIVPFVYPIIHHFRSFGFNLPDVGYVLQTAILVGTMVIRNPPVRVTANPLFWLLAFLATYWGFLAIGLENHGTQVAPSWITDSITILGLIGIFWARISLGRNIGFVPAQREIVMHGAYRFIRHPIYAVIFLSIIGAMLERWSLRNAIALSGGILLFGVKSFIEEGVLKNDPAYVAYMRRVPHRFIPGVF
ncbi:MAG: methyltransferase family protein [Stellaceae bacterium]